MGVVVTLEGTHGIQRALQRSDQSSKDGTSLVDLATVLLKHWRATVGFPLSLGLLTAVASFGVRSTYTATTTFVPESAPQGRLPTELAGIATQFGFPLGSEASRSPKFYAEVVKSRELMEHVLLSKYAESRPAIAVGDSVTLLQILAVVGPDSAENLHRGIKKLDKLVSVRLDNLTNIVTLSVDAPYPALAASVANKFVDHLNAFNAQHRQSQARERRKFVEQRMVDVEHDLRDAEETLRSFYERNRSWQQSPQLTFEEGRLRRQLEIRQDVYLTLRRQYETARIEEVNDTPVITVIDPAVPPKERSRPQRKVLVILALFLGGVVGVFWAFSVEYVDHIRRHEPENYSRVAQVARQAQRDLGGLLRAVLGRKRQL